MENFSEKLAELETKLSSLKIKRMAEKQSLEQALKKRGEIEARCQSQYGISLAEVPDKIKELSEKIEAGINSISTKLEEIDNDP